jgi:hypothetical protein
LEPASRDIVRPCSLCGKMSERRQQSLTLPIEIRMRNTYYQPDAV